MSRYENVTSTIGRTPIIKLNKVTAGCKAEVYLKCEFFNPLASVKDRIGVSRSYDAVRSSGLGRFDQNRRCADDKRFSPG